MQPIRRYNRAAAPGMLKGYLRARTHALRWVEEGIRFKNEDIEKPVFQIDDLPRFTLNVNDVSGRRYRLPAARSAREGRRLDIGEHLAAHDTRAGGQDSPSSRRDLGR